MRPLYKEFDRVEVHPIGRDVAGQLESRLFADCPNHREGVSDVAGVPACRFHLRFIVGLLLGMPFGGARLDLCLGLPDSGQAFFTKCQFLRDAHALGQRLRIGGLGASEHFLDFSFQLRLDLLRVPVGERAVTRSVGMNLGAIERDAREQADYEAKMKAREEKTARTGKKPGGKPPAPPSSGVRPTDQINLTDEDSRIMPATGKGFDQSYNAQAAVDTESMLVVATGIAQVAIDKQQVVPMLEALGDLPDELGRVKRLLGDNGFFSATNVERCVAAKVEPLLAPGRDGHHPHWEDRFTEPWALNEPASAVDRMKHRLKTRKGRKLYGLRKQTVEPVFGIIKSVMRFRQFLLRGLAAVQGEWKLVTMAWNIKRMAVMAG